MANVKQRLINESVTTLDDDMTLTTKDNPFNPKTEYFEWKEWDESHGYNTESYVARLLDMQGIEFDVDDDLLINALIDIVYDSILKNDVLNIYKLV
jgi:hypothetical protein